MPPALSRRADVRMNPVPGVRLNSVNEAPVRPAGRYVLYWMIAARRARWNFGLQRAAEWCAELGKPLVVLEALRCDYRWASERLHRFVLDGMADNAARLAETCALYYPYAEPARGRGKGLLAALARNACVVVTDEFPCFFLPRMVRSAAQKLPVRLEQVDSNGLLPLRASDRVFSTAYAFRRFLQRNLPGHLGHAPEPDPLKSLKLPKPGLAPDVLRRWPPYQPNRPAGFPVDTSVAPTGARGGSEAAESRLKHFLKRKLARYGERRPQPDADATSGLSPYLHFGHISVHRIFRGLGEIENWSPGKLGKTAAGKKKGWWGISSSAEAFLDELVTWRELGFNFCSKREDYDRFESLPQWARRTLAAHSADRREYVYSLGRLERARTHDPLWNAAQTQLLREGRVHGYLRMLWGKKIVEWSSSAQKALSVMIELNNKYALDGRDPNSYSGIFWVLGRYDRPWGPERRIFGTVRYMSSENTSRKLKVKEYVRAYSAPPGRG